MLKRLKEFYEEIKIRSLWSLLPYKWQMLYYEKIKPIYNPRNKRLRKFIPRTWVDIVDLSVSINFEMIKVFYEDEYKKGFVDWNSDEFHKAFAKWLEDAYEYITVKRPQLDKELMNSYPPTTLNDWKQDFVPVEVNGQKMYEYKPKDTTPYEIKYAKVIEIEKLIEESDTKLLHDFIDKRKLFWT
jgi:hypothetical protein